MSISKEKLLDFAVRVYKAKGFCHILLLPITCNDCFVPKNIACSAKTALCVAKRYLSEHASAEELLEL